MIIRALSYNIHKGFNFSKTKFTLEAIRGAIRKTGTDLVFLQEVQGEHKSRPNESQFEFLADRIWSHYSYGKNAVYDAGHHGNAILSKYPILSTENIDVSHGAYEQRGLLHATIQLPNGYPVLHALCVHFGLFESGRTFQVQKLLKQIQKKIPPDEPVIVAGDFNDFYNRSARPIQSDLNFKEAYHEIHGDHAPTFPVWWPILKLDRIYSRGLKIKTASTLCKTPWNQLSDHAALSADFHLKRST